ncbi:MAG TPA: hypothetical protein VN690_06915 [Terriglobales bacterium]|nr:hypothetical protein [Terriglobales bacterium]
MSFRTTAILSLFLTAPLLAPPSFAGTWVLNPAKSRNLGMMARMADTVTINQSSEALVVRDDSEMNGSKMSRVTRYDLTGKSVANTSPTGDPAHTVSHWDGAQLVTTWETEGSVAGSVHRRTERRYLSQDGRTLFEVSETAPGDPKALMLVFDRR